MSTRWRLNAMMFLEFFIWGAWLPLIFGYLPSLGFDTSQQSWVLNAFTIGSFTAMFGSAQWADRSFAAERFLAASHLVGGLAILALAWVHDFWPFFLLMLVHSLCYVPTISITNSIAFAQMKDAQKEFGIVRMGGTIGWIMAAWPMTFILVDWDAVGAAQTSGFVDWLGTVLGSGLTGPALQAGTRWTFVVAGIASFVLAGFSLTLPHTPPKPVASGADKFAWLESLRLLAVPFILILWLVTFIDSTVHNLFFNWTGTFLGTARAAGGVGIPGNWIMPVMSIGQIAEISTMAILGVTLKRLGWRTTMILGILGHAARFAVFAFFPEYKAAIILINVIHGVAYAFFFATVYIFVDEFFPKDVRASAQGLFNLLILGLGPLVANVIGPKLMGETFKTATGVDFRSLFMVPLTAAVVAAVILAIAFHPPARKSDAVGTGVH
jgi:nucleoside transporter